MTNHGLLSSQVQAQYIAYRRQGAGRNDAVRMLTERYAQELCDVEDAPAVVEGILRALARKRELSQEIAQQMQQCLSHCPSEKSAEILLSASVLYGSEAAYRHSIPYDPQWQLGDLFCHTLRAPRAHSLGIFGWSVLFYKVGAYENTQGKRVQLAYMSLCPAGQEPALKSQLQALGFLRMMRHGERWDYLAQIEAKSKRYLDSYELKKIGNFPDLLPPEDRTEENPLVAMPMFGALKKEDSYPDFENQVCNIVSRCNKIGVPCLSAGI